MLYTPWIVEISVGYVKFPSTWTSTLVRTGNLMGVKILYVTPHLNKMIESELKFASAAVRPGVSSWPGAWGTTNFFVAEAMIPEACARNKTHVERSIFRRNHSDRKTGLYAASVSRSHLTLQLLPSLRKKLMCALPGLHNKHGFVINGGSGKRKLVWRETEWSDVGFAMLSAQVGCLLNVER